MGILGRAMRAGGYTYLVLLFVVMMYGYVIAAQTDGLWAAWQSFGREWSPFNIVDWTIRLVLASPGIGLVIGGGKLAGRGSI